MSSFFDPRPRTDVWFSLGRLQVTTTVLVTLVSLIGTIVSAFAPVLLSFTAMTPATVMNGEFWRLITWPWADAISIWSLLTYVLFWYFGTMLENSIGRNQMLRFLAWTGFMITIAHLVSGIVMPGGTVLFGLAMPQLIVLLIFITEDPKRLFLFRIPAWVLGIIIVGLQVLSFISIRNFGALFGLLLSLAGAAIVARSMGMLSNVTWLPGVPKARKPKPRKPTKQETQSASDEDRLDTLLSKISAEGIHSLSKKERAELEKIRKRRRRS